MNLTKDYDRDPSTDGTEGDYTDYGGRCAELNAIPSTDLRGRVQDTIEAHITNRDEWVWMMRQVEATERESLETVVASLGGTA